MRESVLRCEPLQREVAQDAQAEIIYDQGRLRGILFFDTSVSPFAFTDVSNDFSGGDCGKRQRKRAVNRQLMRVVGG